MPRAEVWWAYQNGVRLGAVGRDHAGDKWTAVVDDGKKGRGVSQHWRRVDAKRALLRDTATAGRGRA